MKEFEDILSVMALVGIGVLAVFLLIRIWYFWHTRQRRQPLQSATRSVMVLRIAGIILER